MPYIITTTPRPTHDQLVARIDGVELPATRIAVATPDEARDYVHALGANYGVMAHLDCVLDGTSRMPIGPLPDGAVIEVRAVSWREAVKASGIARRQPSYWFAVNNPTAEERESILTAFNAA